MSHLSATFIKYRESWPQLSEADAREAATGTLSKEREEEISAQVYACAAVIRKQQSLVQVRSGAGKLSEYRGIRVIDTSLVF